MIQSLLFRAEVVFDTPKLMREGGLVQDFSLTEKWNWFSFKTEKPEVRLINFQLLSYTTQRVSIL